MAKNEFHERLINLMFAFLHADVMGRRFLTAEWIRNNVAGYSNRSDAAFQRMFVRDREILAKVGVPIETISHATIDDLPGYRLEREDYFLAPVSFTPEEAAVLALAGDKGLNQELAAFARSGWTKLAAAGATTVSDDTNFNPVVFNNVNDLGVLTAESLDIISQACREKKRIEFDYTAHKAAAPIRRIMDPWGIVNNHDRIYLLGFDIERNAVRTFRITRVDNISITSAATNFAPQDSNLQDFVQEALTRGRVVVDALVRVTAGTAGELTARASQGTGDVYTLSKVDRDWLVRTAAAYAPHAVVLEPTDVRNAVVKRLELAAHNYGVEDKR